MIKYFHQYLKGNGNQKPLMFSIAVDGSYAIYWYCPASQCSSATPSQYNKLCEKEAGVQCKIFARDRYIKWKNGINVGKGKTSKISSKLSFTELKAKLTELGFYGNTSSTTTQTIDNSTTTQTVEKKKETKQTSTTKIAKKNTSKGDLNGFMDALEKAKNAENVRKTTT